MKAYGRSSSFRVRLGSAKRRWWRHFSPASADRDSARICKADCVEYYGAGEAYQPLFDALTRLCRQPGGEFFLAALRRYAPTWLAQLPGLQTQAELRALQRRTAGATPERMVRELTDALDAMSVHAPIVLCLEDLHWSDPSTLDWITYFARRPDRARVLLVATYRHEEVRDPRRSPQATSSDLGIKGLCTQIALAPLDETAVVEYVSRRFPAAPGAGASLEQLARIAYQHTDGNPLFLVNVFNDLFARGVLVCDERGWVIQEDVDPGSLGIPVDVRRTIDRQLDRLNEFERRLLEVASVVGPAFAGAAVSAAADVAIERCRSHAWSAGAEKRVCSRRAGGGMAGWHRFDGVPLPSCALSRSAASRGCQSDDARCCID